EPLNRHPRGAEPLETLRVRALAADGTEIERLVGEDVLEQAALLEPVMHDDNDRRKRIDRQRWQVGTGDECRGSTETRDDFTVGVGGEKARHGQAGAQRSPRESDEFVALP